MHQLTKVNKALIAVAHSNGCSVVDALLLIYCAANQDLVTHRVMVRRAKGPLPNRRGQNSEQSSHHFEAQHLVSYCATQALDIRIHLCLVHVTFLYCTCTTVLQNAKKTICLHSTDNGIFAALCCNLEYSYAPAYCLEEVYLMQ